MAQISIPEHVDHPSADQATCHLLYYLVSEEALQTFSRANNQILLDVIKREVHHASPHSSLYEDLVIRIPFVNPAHPFPQPFPGVVIA